MLEPFPPFLDVHLLPTFQVLEVSFREMKLEPRTNELERASVRRGRLAFCNTHICIFWFVSYGVENIIGEKNLQATGAGMDTPFVALACR